MDHPLNGILQDCWFGKCGHCGADVAKTVDLDTKSDSGLHQQPEKPVHNAFPYQNTTTEDN